MQDNKIIKAIYTLFLGVLISLFVGVGINTFYPGPKAPEYPSDSYAYEEKQSAEQTAKQKDFDKKMRDHEKAVQPHSRNVSLIALVAAVILLITSILAQSKLKELSDGVMLGGLFTLLYSIMLSFMAENDKYTFLVVTVGLVLVMHQGYHRLVMAPHKTSKKK